MVNFPSCKINLGLHILSKRQDGYHEVETPMLSVPLNDVLEITLSDEDEFVTTGLAIPGTGNLCTDFAIPPVRIHLHKNIPMGGGLGGGSSDAAAVLTLLNDLCQLNCSDEVLENYAAHLGSDCAFFIKGGTQLCTGRGEILTPMSVSLSGYWIVLINNGTHVSTKTAFEKVIPHADRPSVLSHVSKPIAEWKTALQNDFEVSVFATYPELAAIKSELYEKGAIYASMSGSGSTMYGIFEEKPSSISWSFESVFEHWITL
jgi:4-diphosphocytidyl-2-C-methyl-D-erythritol kinase